MRLYKLEDYKYEILNIFLNDERYVERKEEIKLLMIEKIKSLDYIEIYRKFKKSSGNEREVLGSALLVKQQEHGYFIESDILDEIIEYPIIDVIWDLSKNAQNELVREKCYEKVISIIDKYYEYYPNYPGRVRKNGKHIRK